MRIVLGIGCLLAALQPTPASAFGVPLLAVSLLVGKQECAKAFPEMRESLAAAFDVFVQRNTKYFNAEAWRQLDRPLVPTAKPLTRVECEQYLHELPTLDADALIERIDRETRCQRDAEREYALVKGKRPAIGVDLAEGLEPRVQRVSPASPAAKAGVRAGDRVLTFGGAAVQTACELALSILRAQPAVEVPIVLIRDGNEVSLRVTPGTVTDD